MLQRILCVDDDLEALRLLSEQLSELGILELARLPEQALLSLAKSKTAVVVLDLRVHGMRGLDLLDDIARRSPDTKCVLLAEHADASTAIHAINQGHVFRLLTKPHERKELQRAVSDAIRQHSLEAEHRVLLEETLAGCVRALMEVLGVVGPRAYRRSIEIKRDVGIVARAAGLEPLWEIEIAALLSQLGHMTVPPELEQKRWAGAPLNAVEQEIFDRVPEHGFTLLRGIPRLENVAAMVLLQSKHWDGTGQPLDRNVAREALPGGARLLKILGDRQTLLERGHSPGEAWQILCSSDGVYDPHLLSIARATLGSADPHSDVEARHVQVSMLAAGDRLLADVRLLDGRLLLSSGQVITAATLGRLRSFARLNPIREPLLISPAPDKRTEDDPPGALPARPSDSAKLPPHTTGTTVS